MVEKAVEGKMNGMNRVTAVGMGMALTGMLMLFAAPSIMGLAGRPPDDITIFVTDMDGTPIEGATVHYFLDPIALPEEYNYEWTEETDEDGYAGTTTYGLFSYGDIFKVWAEYQGKSSAVVERQYEGTGWAITLVVPVSVTGHEVKISVSPSGGGSVSGEGNYRAGDTVTIRATPNPGYEFDRWEGYLMSKENPKSFEMPSADVEITAYFKKTDIPPETGTLLVNTTPVRGKIYVNGQLWGTAPQSRELSPGTYTITFGEVSGYVAPDPIDAVVKSGETTREVGYYTEEIGSFDLSLSSTSVQVLSGQEKDLLQVTALEVGKWDKNIVLSYEVPEGAGFSLVFDDQSIAPGETTTVSSDFDGVLPGEYTCKIIGSSGGYEVEKTFTVVVSEAVTTYKVSGTVTCGEERLKGIEVEAVKYPSGESVTVTTDANGYYELQLERDKTYTLYFTGRGYESETRGPFTLESDVTYNVEMKRTVTSVLVQSTGIVLLISGIGVSIYGATRKRW